MSLKAFHIFFVVVSILMCVVVGAWGLFVANWEQGVMPAVLGYGGFIAAVVLGIYGVWVLNKLKRFSYV